MKSLIDMLKGFGSGREVTATVEHDVYFEDPFKGETVLTGPVKPMLLSELGGYQTDIMRADYVFVQPKLNGWRSPFNTHTRKLYTRSMNEITTLEHIKASLPTEGSEWLDGELYAHGFTLGEIQSMISKGDKRINLHVFDCIDGKVFSERYVDIPVYIHNVETIKISPERINDYYEYFLNLGYEGMVIRLDGYGYHCHRSTAIFKMKPGTEGM